MSDGSYPIVGVVKVVREPVGLKLIAQHIDRAITSPVTANYLLLKEALPSDVDGDDYVENSVEATAGTTESGSVSATFICPITQTMNVYGTFEFYLKLYLALAQVDVTYTGSVSIDSVNVEVSKYDVVNASSTSVVSITKNIGKSLSGTTITDVTFTEPVAMFLSSKEVFDANNLLQIIVTVNFSATTDASATTTTIAKARIVFRRSWEDTYVIVPIV